MNIYVRNESTVLGDDLIESWMPAFNLFVSHVRYWWPRSAKLIFTENVPTLSWQLVFADTSDEAGALGYHDFTPDGRPISYVFAADDQKYGYSPTVTATHEIAEMIADPWISQVFQISDTDFWAQEICDPCEADEFGYEINGVLCSDFVTPRYFIPDSGGGYTFDHTRHITQPLQLLSGGYMSIFVSGKGWKQIYADKVTGRLSHGEFGQALKPKDGFGRSEKYGRERGQLYVEDELE